MKKVIIFGGTFNPIHNAHLEIAKVASEKLGGAKVLFMPNGLAPHKETDLSLMNHRAEMVKIAIKGYKNFEYFGLEIESGKICYSFDSLTKINKIFKDKDIYFLTGEDFLYTVQEWENAEGLFDLATFIVFSRPQESFNNSLTCTKNNPYDKIAELEKTDNGNIIYLDDVNIDLSASYIRKMFKGTKKDRDKIRDKVPTEVYSYIRENKLYKTDDYTFLIQSIERDLVVQLSAKRAHHTISVANESRRLAKLHNENEDKAYIAGLLHDIAKEFPDDKMVFLLSEKGYPTNKYDDINLNHALASRIIADEVYGIEDEDILYAIENHTFGRVGMTKLEMIVSIADVIEPLRKFKGQFKENIDKVRELAETSILNAYIFKLESLIGDFNRLGKTVDQNTILIYEELLRKEKNDR